VPRGTREPGNGDNVTWVHEPSYSFGTQVMDITRAL